MSRWKKGAAVIAVVGGLGVLGVGGLVGYAALTADSKLSFPDAEGPDITASTDPEVIAQGRYLVHGPAHCSQCHSTGDRNHPELIPTAPLSGGLAFEMGPIAARYARNLTPDETGIANLTDAQLARAIRTGVMHDGEISIFMRLSIAELSDQDLTAVISYLRSLEPIRNEVPPGEFFLLGKVLITYAFPPILPRDKVGPAHVGAADEPTVERGRYLAEHVMACALCHTAMDPTTFAFVGEPFAGSLPDVSHGEDSDMEFVAPNLTSDPTGVLARLDEDAFVARLKSGRVFTSSVMPWENFQAATEDDLRSVYRYLQTVPPVANDVGPTYRKQGWEPEG